MKFGFDLDGTLDREEIKNLANALFDAGHEVYVITGYITGNEYGPKEKAEKVVRLGVRNTKMLVAEGNSMEDVGYMKAKILESHEIPFMVDDDVTFLKQMKANSTAQLLMVI